MSKEDQETRYQKQTDILIAVLSENLDSREKFIDKIFEFYKKANIRYRSTRMQMSIGFSKTDTELFEETLDLFGLDDINDLYEDLS